MPRSLCAVLLLSVLLAGCTEPPAAVAPTAAVPAGSPPAEVPPAEIPPPDEPPGANACAKVVAAVREGTLMTPAVVADVLSASSTADAPVADEAQRLSAAFTAAVAAGGTDSEPDAVAAVSAAAAAMVKVCNDSGLETVG